MEAALHIDLKEAAQIVYDAVWSYSSDPSKTYQNAAQALLTGRKTGKPRRTPVGDGRIGGQFWILAEHGMNAGYVRNIACNSCVRLKLGEGLRSRWYSGTAHLLPEDNPRERQRWLAGQLPSSARNARACGFSVLTVRIDLDA